MNQLIFGLFSILIFAETKTYTLDELCKYDSYCRYSFDEKGKTYTVKPEVRFIVANLHEEIVAAGEKYGVDPRAIAGAIAAENTLNVQLGDEIQNYLAAGGTTSIAGKSFSFGLGQLKTEAAMIGEATIAKIEGRPVRDENTISEQMLVPGEAVKLVAGVMRHAQDTYKDKGIDISKQPDILTTLYNLGEPELRVQSASADNPPRSNYFGAFVVNNIAEIQDSIGWSPEKGKYRPLYLNSNNYGVNTLKVNQPMSLSSKPPTCSSQEMSTRKAELARAQTFNSYRTVGKIKKDYTIIDQAIDCEMQRWVLVQTPEGDSGWVKHIDLEKNSTKTYGRAGYNRAIAEQNGSQLCKKSVSSCKNKIAEITGTKAVSSVNKFSMMVTVNAPEGVETPSIKQFFPECYENQIQASTTGNSRGYDDYGQLTALRLRAILKAIEQKKNDLLKQLKISNWSQAPKDLKDVFTALENKLNSNKPKYDKEANETRRVTIFERDLNEILSIAPISSTGSSGTGAKYFGDMSSYNNSGSSFANSPYSAYLDKIENDLVGYEDSLYWGRDNQAGAPNILNTEVALGPASAPRGRNEGRVNGMVNDKKEIATLNQRVMESCRSYPSHGLTPAEVKKLLGDGTDESIRWTIKRTLKDLHEQCIFMKAIKSGANLANFENCKRGMGDECKMHYLEESFTPPFLTDDYFSMDYIKSNKDLLDPNKIAKAFGDELRSRLSTQSSAPQKSTSGEGLEFGLNCSYDPLRTIEKIELLSQLDCVGNIFVPEGDLFNGADKKSIPKVSYRPLQTDDSYQIVFKGCTLDRYTEAVVEEEEAQKATTNAQ